MIESKDDYPRLRDLADHQPTRNKDFRVSMIDCRCFLFIIRVDLTLFVTLISFDFIRDDFYRQF